MTDSKRNPYFDTIKFILIFLVVFGHLLESKMGHSLLCNEMHAFIYLFHMPLFIFISGYFSNKCDSNKFWKSELRLFETLAVFHVGSLLYKLAINHTLGLSDLVIPGFGSWYLLSLMCWKAVLQFLPEQWLKPLPLLTASLAISLLGGFVPIGGAFSIQRTLSLFPFFAAGYTVNETKYLSRLKINKLTGGVFAALSCCHS